MSVRLGSPSDSPGRLGLVRRRPSAKEQVESRRALQRFVRLEHWNGFSTGDVVRVAGHSARGRHWRFRAHVTNTSNGACWVEVALVDGPAPSRRPSPAGAVRNDEPPLRVERVRSFEPELISARWGRLGARGRVRRSAAAEDRSEGSGGVAGVGPGPDRPGGVGPGSGGVAGVGPGSDRPGGVAVAAEPGRLF